MRIRWEQSLLLIFILVQGALADYPVTKTTPNQKIQPSANTSHATDWPRWRGPKADGVADGRNLPTKWSQTKNVRWSVKLPGWGTSSPVVHRNRIYVTSETEADDKKSLLTLCFDRETGRELWRDDFGLGVDQKTYEKSNLAVNTPAATNDAVYVAFGNSDIAGYTHDGTLLWVHRYMESFGNPKMSWGYGQSPLVLDDAVLIPWDHHTGPCFLIGLDKQTGKVAWKKDRPIGTAHATPLLVEHHSQTDILVPGKHKLTAFDALTHEELWQYGEGEGPFNGEIIVSPVYGDGIVFLQLWRKSLIHAIRLNGDGAPPTALWVSEKPGPVEPSLLYYRGLLYALMDNGVLVCLDGKTGKEHYRHRLGGDCNSSPIASDGHIYLSNNDGTTFVVRAGTAFELLAQNKLGERITASPAISGNELVYRTDSHLYCIGKKTAEISDGSQLTNGVTAHRGNSGDFPENTLPAFQSGIDVGADWIELDILRSKDGQLVVIHDTTTKRVGDQNLVVAEATYEELAKVDVATDFRRRTGNTLEACPPQRIPLLKDVLLLAMKQNRTRVSIQPKTDCVAAAVALVKELKAERWVGFNDGNLAYMTEVMRLAPDIPVFWDRGASTDIDSDISIAKQHRFEALVLHHSGVTPEKVRKIKAAGIEVGAWTVNDAVTMTHLLDAGVERLYTDFPSALLKLKKERQNAQSTEGGQ